METKILMVSDNLRAAQCAAFLSGKLQLTIERVSNKRMAFSALRRCDFHLVMMDVEMSLSPEDANLLWQYSAAAIPMRFQMPSSDCTHLVREIRSALARREREQVLARRALKEEMEDRFKSAVTGILLESQMALAESGEYPAMQQRLQQLSQLAVSLKDQLRPQLLDQ